MTNEPNVNDIFFKEDSTGKFRARSLLIDSEPLVIDDVLRSSHASFYGSKQVIQGQEAACYAPRGNYRAGRELVPDALDSIRLQVE